MLILKRASASRPSSEWDDDDFDVLADGGVVGRIMKTVCRASWLAVDVDARLRPSRRSHADARLCGDARGRDGAAFAQSWRRPALKKSVPERTA